MDTCNVRGCTGGRETIFATGDSGLARREWLVCKFDLRQLELDAPWTEDPDTGEIILGDAHAPLDVLSYKVFLGGGSPVVTLELGRDEIAETALDLRIPEADLQAICSYVTKSVHTKNPGP